MGMLSTCPACDSDACVRCECIKRKMQKKIDALAVLLREAKRGHVNTLSRDGQGGTYCQTFVRDNRTGENGSCTCGAAAWNARVDAALEGE